MNAEFPIRDFPQIFPLNPSRSKVGGFINVQNEDFYICLEVSQINQEKKVHLRGTWKLQQLLKPVISVLHQRLDVCCTIVDMLKEVASAIREQLQMGESTQQISSPSAEYYGIVLKHLQDVGWNKVHFINSDLDCIHLKAVDDCQRQHILQVTLPQEFPKVAPICNCDLPEDFIFKWASNRTLLDLYNHFLSCLEKYTKFWYWMNEVDEFTWILEPEKPTYSSCKRRIALAPSASLLIVVDPSSLSSVPLCQFMGPEYIVAPLKKKFNENIYGWDENITLLNNLKNILDVEFPSPLTSTKEEFCIACGICYSYKLVEELPDVICGEPKCKQPYHRTCLYEWLKSLPTTRHNFNTIFGDCPYCNMTVWFTLPVS